MDHEANFRIDCFQVMCPLELPTLIQAISIRHRLSCKQGTIRPSGITIMLFDSLPHDKNVDWTKLKGIADDKMNMTQKLNFFL